MWNPQRADVSMSVRPVRAIRHRAVSAIETRHGAHDPIIAARVGEASRLVFLHVEVV